MRIFITGATGFVGSHVVKELIAGGHTVVGLARSEASAQALTAMGGEPLRGVLEDVECLKRGAAASEAVIHLGFNHEFSSHEDFVENCQTDKRAIEAMGSVLAGSERPFIVTTGLAGLAGPGEIATEESVLSPHWPIPRVSELTALGLESKGVRVSVMRLPQVHDTAKQGLVSFAIVTARSKGVSAYVGEGTNRWAAAPAGDVARLYRLAVEKPEAGAKWHAVSEVGAPLREIAESIGRGLNVPVKSIPADEAPAHFGWWGVFAGSDLLATSEITRRKLGWEPTGRGLLADLAEMDYSSIA